MISPLKFFNTQFKTIANPNGQCGENQKMHVVNSGIVLVSHKRYAMGVYRNIISEPKSECAKSDNETVMSGL